MAIKTVSSLNHLVGERIWIYNWNAAGEQFYCIPVLRNDKKNGIVRDPIAVNLSSNFSAKYNHLVIVTNHPEEFQQRLSYLISIKMCVRIPDDKEGHLIMKQLTAREIVGQRNKGTPVLVYTQHARELYELLRINYYFFFIESMGGYESSVQCYFNHMRANNKSNKPFGSRGLFEIIKNGDDVEDSLCFISEDVDEHFPSYKITSFDIEAARFDDNFPTGNTSLDRLCSVAFQTVIVPAASKPREYNVFSNIIFVYLPSRSISSSISSSSSSKIVRCSTEKELVQRVLAYICLPNSIFLTGWNIMKYDYRFLFNRAVYYNSVPKYISEYKLYRMCAMTEVFDLAPPWKLSIDTMECRKQFYPRHLVVNPPSNSIDATARALLPGGLSKTTIKITRINKVYKRMESITTTEDDDEEEDIEYMKQLIEYNIRDVQLVTDLNGVLQIIQTLIPLSALADLNPGDCINYNATRVCLTFMRNQFQSVMIAPIDYNVIYNRGNHGVLYRKTGKYSRSGHLADLGKKGTYKGATVLDPKIGVHTTENGAKTLACFDFASLYPSIMRTFSIIRGYVTRTSISEFKKNENDFYRVHFTPLFIPEDDQNVYLSLKNCESSPIQYLCKWLIEKRKANKVKAPTLANALKIISNSLYGLCGVKGVLYDEVAVSMTTGYGREFLLDVKKYFETKYQGLKVLYGDTDSIFVVFDNTTTTTTTTTTTLEMVSRYNRYLDNKIYPGINALQLSVDAEFQCIIFIRKKLYMAILSSSEGKKMYKLSGFPQRVDPKTHSMMTEALHGILEIAIRSSRDELPDRMKQFYRNLFDNHTKKNNENNDFFNLKVKALDTYKSRTSKNYHVGSAYEKSTGFKIHDVAYVSVCEVVPLVRKIPRKSFSICLEMDFDYDLYCMNQSATLTEFLSKTFDPILMAITDDDDDDDDDESFTLKQMSRKYIESLQKESLLKHIANGFAVYDFSDCVCRQPLLLKICVRDSWPEFYRRFVSNRSMRGGSSHRIPWVLEDYCCTKDERKEKNIRLNIKIHFLKKNNTNGLTSYATLCNSPPALFAGVERKFYSLDELGKLMTELVPDRRVLSKIYINICNPLTKNSTLGDILMMLNFIYRNDNNKSLSLTYTQIQNIFDNDKFVIILPFITIKRKGNIKENNNDDDDDDDDEDEDDDEDKSLIFSYY